MRTRSVHRFTLPRPSPRRRDRHSSCRDPHWWWHAKLATLRACGRRCVYCGTGLCLESMTLDHVVPLSRGGPSAPGNLVSACVGCNQKKGSQLLGEFIRHSPWAGPNFLAYARPVHHQLKREARRAISLVCAVG